MPDLSGGFSLCLFAERMRYVHALELGVDSVLRGIAVRVGPNPPVVVKGWYAVVGNRRRRGKRGRFNTVSERILAQTSFSSPPVPFFLSICAQKEQFSNA